MNWDIKDIKNWNWRAHPSGAAIKDAGNSKYFITGGWRAVRPVCDENKCNNCLICFMFCPDSAILIKDEKMSGFDLDFCKGCGICAKECPQEAITMIEESEAQQGQVSNRCTIKEVVSYGHK